MIIKDCNCISVDSKHPFRILKGIVDELNRILSVGAISRILFRKKYCSQISELAQSLSNALTDFQVCFYINYSRGINRFNSYSCHL